jgi:pimeloyl-ACP methyl ester carboxylesterase
MRNRLIGGVVAGLVAMAVLAGGPTTLGQGESSASLTVRGKTLTLRTFGTRGKPPVVVASGDGGWIHLGPHIASFLAARGFFVVGLDSKDYLTKFTTDQSTLSQADVPADFRALADFAASGSADLPILIGVSEGAGLIVLAATRPDVQQKVRGVIGVGLPDVTELAWRWRDNMIYFTHRAPNEPTFNTASVVEAVSPVPLAAIHSTHDEFAPLEAVKAIVARAKEPKRLWIVDAADHGFSDKRPEFDARLLEAVAWVTSAASRAR